jgi:hypothetical protein
MREKGKGKRGKAKGGVLDFFLEMDLRLRQE